MEQIAENESVLQSDGNAGEKEVKKKPWIKRKTLREYLFVYGMLLLPLIQFAIFYIWINANSILLPRSCRRWETRLSILLRE